MWLPEPMPRTAPRKSSCSRRCDREKGWRWRERTSVFVRELIRKVRSRAWTRKSAHAIGGVRVTAASYKAAMRSRSAAAAFVAAWTSLRLPDAPAALACVS